MRRLNVFLLTLLVFMLAIIPRALLYRNQVADPFLFGNVAYVQRVLPTGHILPVPASEAYRDVLFHPALETMIGVIWIVTALPIYAVTFLPIGGFLFLLTSLVLARRLTKSKWLALGFGLYTAYEISLIGAASVFTHAWAGPLFICFILVYLDALHSKTVARTVILLLLFLGAHLYYYTVEVWMLVFSLAVNAVLLSRKHPLRRIAQAPFGGRTTVNLAILFCAFFLAYNQIIYAQFFPSFEPGNLPESASIFLSEWAGIIPLPSGPLPRYSASSTNPVSFGLNLVFSLFVLVPVLVFAARATWHKVRGMNRDAPGDGDFLIWGNVATTVGDVGIYASYGPASVKSVLQRSLVFLLPLSAMQSVSVLAKSRQAMAVFLVLLLALTALRFGAAIALTDNYQPPTIGTTWSSYSWLSNHTESGQRILSDFDTSGVYTLESSLLQHSFIPVDYTNELYGRIVAPKDSRTELGSCCDFVAVYALGLDRRISAPLWKFYEPLRNNLPGLESNTHLARVYDDGNVWLFVSS